MSGGCGGKLDTCKLVLQFALLLLDQFSLLTLVLGLYDSLLGLLLNLGLISRSFLVVLFGVVVGRKPVDKLLEKSFELLLALFIVHDAAFVRADLALVPADKHFLLKEVLVVQRAEERIDVLLLVRAPLDVEPSDRL